MRYFNLLIAYFFYWVKTQEEDWWYIQITVFYFDFTEPLSSSLILYIDLLYKTWLDFFLQHIIEAIHQLSLFFMSIMQTGPHWIFVLKQNDLENINIKAEQWIYPMKTIQQISVL